MNDLLGIDPRTLPPELAAQLAALGPQEMVAKALMERGLRTPQAPETKGRFQSPTSPMEYLGNLSQQMVGRSGMDASNRVAQAIAEQQQKGLMDERKSYNTILNGAPAVKPLTPNDDEGNAMPSSPALGGPDKALEFAQSSKFGLMRDPVVLAQMKAWEKSREPYTLRPDEERRGPNNEVIARGAPKAVQPHGFKVGDIRKFQEGENVITQEYQPDGTWKQLAKGAEKNQQRPYYTFIGTPEGIVTGNARTGQITAPAGPGGSPVMKSSDSPQLQADIASAKKVGTETGDVNVKQHEAAIAAAQNIPKINSLIDNLKNSQAITGPGAELMLGLEKAKQFVTGSEAAGKKVSDTQIVDIMMGSEVFPLIQQLGIGARGMDTPAEREFMRNVLTGSISLNKETLIRMAEIRRDVAQRSLDRFNARVKSGELDTYFSAARRQKGELSPMAPMQSQQPVSGDLTPQEAEELAALRKRFGK